MTLKCAALIILQVNSSTYWICSYLLLFCAQNVIVIGPHKDRFRASTPSKGGKVRVKTKLNEVATTKKTLATCNFSLHLNWFFVSCTKNSRELDHASVLKPNSSLSRPLSVLTIATGSVVSLNGASNWDLPSARKDDRIPVNSESS